MPIPYGLQPKAYGLHLPQRSRQKPLPQVPTKVIIDMRGKGDGVVRFRRDGYTEVRSIEARVQELLDERPAGATR